MFLRFLLFIILFIVLVRVISNLFLPGAKKKNSNARFFYHTFKNMRQQQNGRQYQNQDQGQGQSKVSEDSLDDMEEAEYEDVTEENAKSSSKQ